MWGWKIFAIFSAIVSIWAIFDGTSYNGPVQMLGLAISIPATIGLILFAFNMSFLSARFWRAFAAIYIAYSIAVLGMSVQNLNVQHTESGKGIWIYVGAFAVMFALQFFTSLALWRYSSRPQTI
jgi:hypothetical protein